MFTSFVIVFIDRFYLTDEECKYKFQDFLQDFYLVFI